MVSALGFTGSPEAVTPLLAMPPNLARPALEALQELAHRSGDTAVAGRVYRKAIEALRSRDVALVTTAASLLGDSLFQRPASVPPLLEALNQARVPDDVEAIQEICSTLGKMKDLRAVDALQRELAAKDRSVALAASAALVLITGQKAPDIGPFRPTFIDYDFQYLHGMKDSLCGYFRSDTLCVKLKTDRGEIVLELYKNYAPFTVMSFLKLATRRNFFRGLTFHRIVPNFVIQGGDPRGDGWGGPGYAIRSEFSPLRYETGTLGMASAGKDTEGSQFFITQSPQPHLDGRYTIFGKVKSGMDAVNSMLPDDHILDVKITP